MTKRKTRFVVRWFAVPLAILVGVGTVFLLTEAAFRIAGIPRRNVLVREIPQPGGLTIFRPDPELGWAYVPNTAVRMQFGPPGWVNVFFDENGIRVPADGFRLDPAKPSILFVGCSFTMGHALFYEETFAGKIAALPQFPLQVVNLGVQAYGTDQSLIALKKFISRFNTKIVVYTFIDGHVERNCSSDYKPFFRLRGDQLVQQDPTALHDPRAPRPFPVLGSSRVIDLIGLTLEKKFGNFFLNPEELTRRLVMEMKKGSEAHGAKFVVIHWMWSDKDHFKDIFAGMDLDVIHALDGAPPGWEKMTNAYDGHPLPEANTHIAKLFLNYLLEEPFGDDKPVFGVVARAD